MRYQVRNMVGLLLKVGQEKIDPIMVKQILDSKSRKKNGVTAPAAGLYLVNVEEDAEKAAAKVNSLKDEDDSLACIVDLTQEWTRAAE